MRSTGVRIPGIRCLLHLATGLEGIRCSAYDVLQALASELKLLQNIYIGENQLGKPCSMSLKYLDFSNCFAILHKFLHLMPHLVEVRIGADAPPSMRRSTQRLKTHDILVDNKRLEDSETASEAAIEELPQLPNLRYNHVTTAYVTTSIVIFWSF